MIRTTRLIAGIDEVGRGSLAGPVIAAAVVFDKKLVIKGLADSKKLTAHQRQKLGNLIRDKAIDWSIGRAEASEIDRLNILQASLLAMQRAFYGLSIQPDWVCVDGIYYPEISCDGETVVHGDQLIAEISAASILAKLARDREFQFLGALYPGYNFATHKGYPTKSHKDQLKILGVTDLHRKTFRPVKEALNRGTVS